MKFFIQGILFILFFSTLNAQEDVIKSIKDQYYRISTNIDDYNVHEVEMNFMLPAVGLKTKSFKFYYSSVQKNPEINPYDMIYTLFKVNMKYNISSHSLYSTEFLYNEKGQLIFFLDKLEGAYETYQKRFYYDAGELIKCIFQTKDDTGKTEKYTKTDSFKDENITESISGINKAEQYSDLFKYFEILDDIDK